MSASAWSVALSGTDGTLVEVEVALGGGIPRTVLVGLPDAALYEARDRCRAAVAGAPGIDWPSQLVTINLTPANLPKSGSHYDLAIIAAVLTADQKVPKQVSARSVFLGEVGLDGRVRRVPGLLPALLAARRAGIAMAVVPAEQAREAYLVDGMTIWPVASLADLVEVLNGRPGACDPAPISEPEAESTAQHDLADVLGQPEACWALEVAAAGGHHLFMDGPPGVGKTMLAERMPGLLPELTVDEALEVSAVHSLVGHDLSGGLIRRPPFAAPHHNASMAALIGGGARIARPGAISLAHRGLLFLDEAPEFAAKCIDALRTPLESGVVTIARSAGQVQFPARFQLVMAANPCPCGRYGTKGASCTCSPMSVRRYAERISGPILDRIDIRIRLAPVTSLIATDALPRADSSALVAQRVADARERQAHRLEGTPWRTNAEVPAGQLRKLPAPAGVNLLDAALGRGAISVRGVDKVVRVAWTLADLAGRDRIAKQDLMAALALRQGEGAIAA